MTSSAPQYISMSLARTHYSNKGIKERRQFSVNIPSEDLVVQTDYCGIVSGKRTDKSDLFELFHSELEHTPMISTCPVCMECRLERIIEFPTHEVFVGEIVETHCDEDVLVSGKIDLAKVKPILFDMSSRKYWSNDCFFHLRASLHWSDPNSWVRVGMDNRLMSQSSIAVRLGRCPDDGVI